MKLKEKRQLFVSQSFVIEFNSDVVPFQLKVNTVIILTAATFSNIVFIMLYALRIGKIGFITLTMPCSFKILLKIFFHLEN